ncbi:unnamed protein product [Amoebophrya sp. A120]|nr:unnamed protein product [Amoebophrya sp. A120]|eukprot:GSA120T00023806001.1
MQRLRVRRVGGQFVSSYSTSREVVVQQLRPRGSCGLSENENIVAKGPPTPTTLRPRFYFLSRRPLHTIAVGSCKGGVGKSSIALNLAFQLAGKKNKKVALCDLDVYGPSLPFQVPRNRIHEKHFNIFGPEKSEAPSPSEKDKNALRPQVDFDPKTQLIKPVEVFCDEGDYNADIDRRPGAPSRTRNTVQTMSLGWLRPDEHAALRGPMASGIVQQMLKNVDWRPDLDYLVLDLPPGTGDIHLTVAQQIRVDYCVMITTPQLLSLVDVEKGIKMFHEVGIPTAILVENFSFFTCENCGHDNQMFLTYPGQNAQKMATDFGLPHFLQLPWEPELTRPHSIYVLDREDVEQEHDLHPHRTSGRDHDPSEVDLHALPLEGARERQPKTTTRSTRSSTSTILPLASSTGVSVRAVKMREQLAKLAECVETLCCTTSSTSTSGAPAPRNNSTVGPQAGLMADGYELTFPKDENGAGAASADRVSLVVQILKDGTFLGKIPARKLRLSCRSAVMYDEFTGEKLFKEDDIPLDVYPKKIEPAGRYAVSVTWSDKHSSLFPWKKILPLMEEQEHQGKSQ